jgi:hypothetical protein
MEKDANVDILETIREIKKELDQAHQEDVFVYIAFNAKDYGARVYFGGQRVPKSDKLKFILDSSIKSIVEEKERLEGPDPNTSNLAN